MSFNVRLLCKQPEYAIPSNVFVLNGSLSVKKLNNLVNTILKENNDSFNETKFSFLINGKFLKDTIEKHVKEEDPNFSQETELEIHYLVSEKSPKPVNSCLSDDWISSVQLNQNYIINGCYDGVINIWEIKNCNHLLSIPSHSSAVKDVKWISDKSIFENCPEDSQDLFYFVSCSNDETIIIWRWQLSQGKVDHIFTCKGHSRSVDCLDVNNDLLVSGSYDTLVKVWSLGENKSDNEEEEEEEEKEQSKSKKAKLEIDKDDHSVKHKNKTPIITLSGHSEAVSGIVWINNLLRENCGQIDIASCSLDNTIKLWDLEIGKVSQSLNGSKSFLAIDYSHLNHCLITGSCDRHIRLWDTRSAEGSLVKSSFTSHQGWVTSVKWSPVNENHFISGSYDSMVKEWDIRCTKAPLYDLIGHEDKVFCTDWSNEKYIVSGSADKHLKLYDCVN